MDREVGTRPTSISLRLKLSLWMVLIFLVVQLSLVLVFQLIQRRSISDFYDARIARRAALVYDEISPRGAGVTSDTLHRAAEHYTKHFFASWIFLDVYTVDGRRIASSQEDHPVIPPARWPVAPDTPGCRVIRDAAALFAGPPDTPLRSAACRIQPAGGDPYIAVFVRTDDDAQAMTQLLGRVILWTVPMGVLATACAAWAIAGLAVQPIRTIRQLARGLEPDRLSQTLPSTRAGGNEVDGLRQDLENTRLRLEAAFAVQERFMSNVSHELKTPIAVLMTEAQTLKLEGVSKEVRAYVASSVDELEKLGRMVDSFLLLTRVRHGRAKPPRAKLCYARDIMVESYEGCASMAAQYGVRLSIRVPDDPDTDAAVFGSDDLLRTVLDNLLRNAIRFSPRGETVSVEGRVDAEWLVITVRDRGPGIPPDVLPHIFDRFVQARDEQHRGRGHGLGLSIAMGITEMHGGTISASTPPEGGSEFCVRLPLVLQNADPSPADAPAGPAGPGALVRNGTV